MLKTNLSGMEIDNPIIPASGTFGFGYEYSKFYDINILGSFSTKGITYEKRFGNHTPRIAECENGMLNSIGLQNPGVHDVIDTELKNLSEIFNKKVLANIGGNKIEDYVETAVLLDKCDNVGILELNVSCPNVKEGGIAFGTNKDSLTTLIKSVKSKVTKPLYVKLSPNVTDIVETAIACEEAGADGLVLINTLIGMQIDIKKKKPVLYNKIGGFSGPAIFPVALRMVYQVYEKVNIPIIGVGGITTVDNVIAMLMAGASAVEVGSENLVNPYVCKELIEQLPDKIKELGYENIKDIIGVAHE